MRVEMLGSISGHRVETDEDGTAVYLDNPQRGDVVDVDEDTAASWLRTGMARAVDDTEPVETADVVPPVETADVVPPVETAAVDTSGRRGRSSSRTEAAAAADDQIES